MTGPSTPAAPPRVHPVVLVLLAVVSVQFGGALAATLLPLLLLGVTLINLRRLRQATQL